MLRLCDRWFLQDSTLIKISHSYCITSNHIPPLEERSLEVDGEIKYICSYSYQRLDAYLLIHTAQLIKYFISSVGDLCIPPILQIRLENEPCFCNVCCILHGISHVHTQ